MNQFQSLINRIHLGSVPEFFAKIPDESINLTLTSPPYYDNSLYILDDGTKEFGWGSYDEYLGHIRKVLTELLRITVNAGRVVFVLSNTPQTDEDGSVLHYWPIIHDVGNMAKEIGWELADEAIWIKNKPSYHYLKDKPVPETQLRPHHDMITVWRKPGAQRENSSNLGSYSSLWRFNRMGPIEEYNKMYPSFPTKLVENVLKLWSLPHDMILDPYAGSGQTCRVAKEMDRLFIGIEADERWVGLWDDINNQ